MLFKKGERTVFAVRSFVLPKKYRSRPHFPLTETIVSPSQKETTINISSKPSSSFSFFFFLLLFTIPCPSVQSNKQPSTVNREFWNSFKTCDVNMINAWNWVVQRACWRRSKQFALDQRWGQRCPDGKAFGPGQTRDLFKHTIKKPLSKRKRLNYNNIRRRSECLEDPAATYSPVP